MRTTIKGLLFDKDGTLLDFHATWGGWIAQTLGSLSKGDSGLASKLAEVWGFDFISHEFAPRSIVIAGTPEEMVQAIVPFLPEWDAISLNEHLLLETADLPMVEAVSLKPLMTQFASNGLKIGLSTNDGEAPARSHLKTIGIAGFFDFIAGSDSGYGGKPQPGMQHAFCKHVGLAPDNVAMVGDSTHDLIAGNAAGMHTIGVLTGPAGREELEDHADVVLSDIGEISGYLGLR